ncbi:MAG TPA: hypothetical protein VGC32_15735 [Solirubrobacterales bacterium]
MDPTHHKRVVCGLFLALALLPALCGSALAHGTGRAAKSGSDRAAPKQRPSIGPGVAVSRPKHHRRKAHHKKRRHKKKSPAAAPVAAAPVAAPAPIEPLRSSNCFSSPHSCGYPDPTNTGVPAGVPLAAGGSLQVSQPGAVVSGLQVTGTIQVLASNVTIENTRVIQNKSCGPINTCGNSAIEIRPGLSGVVIRNVETASLPGDTCEHDIRNTGSLVAIEGAYLHACDSNVYAEGPTVLRNSFGIGKIEMSEDHIENIYFNETSFAAIHDTLLNPVDQTAVIFGNSGGGNDVANCSNQLTVLESLIAGGGYSIYPCAHASQAGSSSINIQGNHFARCVTPEGYEPRSGTHPCTGGPDSSGYFAKSGSFGVATDYFSGAGTWRGNVWDNNLGRVCITGSSNGCE